MESHQTCVAGEVWAGDGEYRDCQPHGMCRMIKSIENDAIRNQIEKGS